MNGLPSFRLERDVLEGEIEILRKMGVEFKCGVEVGKDVTIQQLRDQGYKAFYRGHRPPGRRKAGFPGEDARALFPGGFLRSGQPREIKSRPSGKVVVIGGGNMGADVAAQPFADGVQRFHALPGKLG